jgi:hypothetical protein
MADEIKYRKHVYSTAKEAFDQFMDGINYMHPDGGERLLVLHASVKVKEGRSERSTHLVAKEVYGHGEERVVFEIHVNGV